MDSKIVIREFNTNDERQLWDVHYSSIHQVCSKDYNKEQIEAWAPADLDQSIWASKMQSLRPYVAVLGDKVVGYADLQADGEIDHFFVHGDYQSQGVASCLMNKILKDGSNKQRLYAHVSNTAKPFFEKMVLPSA